MNALTLRKKPLLIPLFLYGMLAILILWQSLKPGYIFLLDMTWPSKFQLSDYTYAGFQPQFPIFVLLTVINKVLPAWLLQKMLLLVILVGSGISTHNLCNFFYKKIPQMAPAANTYALCSGIFAMLNPFVFERLAAGQWLVLAGYAYTPWVIFAFFRWKNNWKFWLSYALFPIVSIHFWLMTTLCCFVVGVVFWRRELWGLLKNKSAYALFLLVNIFWIAPLISGSNDVVNGLTRSQYEVFQTMGDQSVSIFGNVVSLHGFWRPQSIVLKDQNRFWFIYSLLIFSLFIYAQLAALRQKQLRRVAKISLFLTPIIFIFSVGYGNEVSKLIIQPLTYLPMSAVLRETAKAIGLLALLYAVWVPYGAFELNKRWRLFGSKNMAVGLIILNISMMSGMFFGLHGTLKSHSYPKDWYSVDKTLSPSDTILVLPWQGYLQLTFADNAFAANPARQFFKAKVLQSESSGNVLLDDPNDPVKLLIDSYLTNEKSYSEFTSELQQRYNVTHIVVLKSGNWERYEGLLHEASAETSDFISVVAL